jgi:hypothetical protein
MGRPRGLNLPGSHTNIGWSRYSWFCAFATPVEAVGAGSTQTSSYSEPVPAPPIDSTLNINAKE